MIGGIAGVDTYSPYLLRIQNMQPANAASAPLSEGIWKDQSAPLSERPVQAAQPAAAALEDAQEAVFGAFRLDGIELNELGVRLRMQQAPANVDGERKEVGAKGVQAAAEEGKCETCEARKYQDGSNDMGVSFKTPTRVAPEAASSAVRGHEMEHVVRERAKAQRENRRVVSQSVTYHTAICPECGRVYVSGGTTRTTTAANSEQPDTRQSGQQQARRSFSVLA